jgi:hypothetical protein
LTDIAPDNQRARKNRRIVTAWLEQTANRLRTNPSTESERIIRQAAEGFVMTIRRARVVNFTLDNEMALIEQLRPMLEAFGTDAFDEEAFVNLRYTVLYPASYC